ncbi:MAG: hypothetical protein QM784_30915 [Polyangiaceae bacterium]
MQRVFLGVPVCSGETCRRPIRTAEGTNPPLSHRFVQDVHQLAHGNARVIAVQQIKVDAVGPQPFQAAVDGGPDVIGTHQVRLDATFAHDDCVTSPTSHLEIKAERLFRLTSAVDLCRVVYVPAGSTIPVE